MQMSYNYLLSLTFKNGKVTKLLLLFFIFVLGLSMFIKGYDKYTTYGIYANEILTVEVPIDNKNVKNAKFYKKDNQKTDFHINNISEIMNNGIINYQTYEISSDSKYLENEVIQITFYSNKEIIIKKIFKRFIGR